MIVLEHQAWKKVRLGLGYNDVHIEAENKEVLLEVIAMSRQHGNAADGVVRAIEAELQGRNVAAQMKALQSTAANQIGALRDVEEATRDQIEVMVRLERKATQLELVDSAARWLVQSKCMI